MATQIQNALDTLEAIEHNVAVRMGYNKADVKTVRNLSPQFQIQVNNVVQLVCAEIISDATRNPNDTP